MVTNLAALPHIYYSTDRLDICEIGPAGEKGNGLFATSKIAPLTPIATYKGNLLSRQEGLRLEKSQIEKDMREKSFLFFFNFRNKSYWSV